MYHILFVHLAVGGHLGCFGFWAIINIPDTHICMQAVLWIKASDQLGNYARRQGPRAGDPAVNQRGQESVLQTQTQ